MNRTSQIITPATAGALTTLDTLKDELGITASTDDVFLARHITSASSWIATVCGRAFGRESMRDTFRRDSTAYGMSQASQWCRQVTPLELSRDLLDGESMVASVTVNGALADPSTYVVEAGPGLVWRVTSSGARVNWTSFPVVVDFTSGWLLPGETNRTLPPVVEDVCVDRAAAAWYNRGRDPSISREVAEGAGTLIYNPATNDDKTDHRLDAFKARA